MYMFGNLLVCESVELQVLVSLCLRQEAFPLSVDLADLRVKARKF